METAIAIVLILSLIGRILSIKVTLPNIAIIFIWWLIFKVGLIEQNLIYGVLATIALHYVPKWLDRLQNRYVWQQ